MVFTFTAIVIRRVNALAYPDMDAVSHVGIVQSDLIREITDL